MQVCTWLLTASVAIVGFAFTHEPQLHLLSGRETVLVLAWVGLAISLLTALVALTYGGYASRNWAKADQIARVNGWQVLDPSDDPWTCEQKKALPRAYAAWALRLSAPRDTYSSLAPIFLVYIALAVLSAAAHLAIILLAVFSLRSMTAGSPCGGCG